jgi:hypothetical protein
MPSVIKSRNTITLASSASNVNNYYNGYTIEFTRLYKVTGKKAIQRSIIKAYDGATRIATIADLWIEDIIPGPEDSTKKDSYRIIPTYADKRVSINPAIQTLDYISSNRYGRGLDPYKDLYLPSWLESARLCDAQSDVTVETTGATTGLSVGDRYRYPATGDILFQGDVQSINGVFVRFTNVLGKLTNKWNSWKTYSVDTIIYNSGRVYLTTIAGSKPTEPTHTSGTSNGLQYLSAPFALTKVSGSGPASLNLPINDNPVRDKKKGAYISGYSLYDSDGIDYFRYLGWDEHAQRYATQHQTNLTIDTSQSLLDNINSLLDHFGGMLRYSGGRYYLEVEDAESGISSSNDPRHITANDITGKIKISDDGIRSSYNSLTVAFADPSNKYEARNISFFNSDYLKSDRNVPKKGNLSIPGITNYYNARLLSERYLTKSRFGLNISFGMTPKGALLLAGRVIELPYDRYGWVNKKFRITDIVHNSDATVNVTAEEYDDSFYQIRSITKPPSVGKAADTTPTTIGSPTNLVATGYLSSNETVGGIELKWTNVAGLDPTNISTEIHMSGSPHYYLVITNLDGDLQTLTTNIPHGLKIGDTITPLDNSNGLIEGTKYYIIAVPTNNTLKLSATAGGSVLSFTGAGTLSLSVSTAVILNTVPYPENKYFDAYTGGNSSTRVAKYYWVRYRVN